MNQSKVLHFYLFVSHGNNTSLRNNYYDVEAPFLNIVMYSKPHEPIDAELLENVKNDTTGDAVCKLIQGGCPVLPHENARNKRMFTLPTLMFAVSADEPSPVVREFTGLYYFQIKKGQPNANKCNIVAMETLLTWTTMRAAFPDPANIAWQQIFGKISQDCNARNIDVKNVSVGVYSCQTPLVENYALTQYNLLGDDIMQIVPQRRSEGHGLQNAVFLPSAADFPENYKWSICMVPGATVNNFMPVARGITYQGCGFNVLAMLQLIEYTDANERAVCLGGRGTSIFKICDYIETKYNNINKFIIFRGALDKMMRVLITYINSLWSAVTTESWAIIFKIYTSNKVPGKPDMFNEAGHTLFFNLVQNKCEIVDPQQAKRYDITNVNIPAVLALIGTTYGASFAFMDIIGVYREQFPEGRLTWSKHDFEELEANGIIIRSKPESVTYGGKKHLNLKKSKKCKHLKKSKKRKSIFFKQKSKKRNRKIVKTRKQKKQEKLRKTKKIY